MFTSFPGAECRGACGSHTQSPDWAPLGHHPTSLEGWHTPPTQALCCGPKRLLVGQRAQQAGTPSLPGCFQGGPFSFLVYWGLILITQFTRPPGASEPWRRARQPTPVLLPGESHDRGAWRAPVHGVTESDTTEQLSNACTERYTDT